jgi:hypothetical protein
VERLKINLHLNIYIAICHFITHFISFSQEIQITLFLNYLLPHHQINQTIMLKMGKTKKKLFGVIHKNKNYIKKRLKKFFFQENFAFLIFGLILQLFF